MDRLLEIAEELYGLPLGDFTARRDAQAKALKASDADLSVAVKRLRKASVAAWVVDLLVRRETDQVEQLLGVGAALRSAQADLDGAELRALTRQRRQLTAAVTTVARRHAKAAGVAVTAAVAEQVEQTLTAAMLDEDAGRAVRSGLLVAALTPTTASAAAEAVAVPAALGFAAAAVADGSDVEASDDPARGLRAVPDPDADAKALAAARARLSEAERAAQSATEADEEAAAAVADLEARALQVQSEIDELRRRLGELEEQAEAVDDELSDAEEARAEAEVALADATRSREAAAAEVERLDRVTAT